MKELPRIQEVFFALLRHAFWGTALPKSLPVLTAQEWEGLYAFARKQDIHAVVFDALGALPSANRPSSEFLGKWVLEVGKVENYSALMRKVAMAQADAWRSIGVEAVILKGVAAASWYPQPLHRKCGDVDWYFPRSGDWEKALEKVAQVGCKVSRDSDGDVDYQFMGVVVEHHRAWNHLASKRSREYVRSLEKPFAKWEGMDVLPAELDLLMLNVHILKHAMVLGVGVRQLSDLAMACRHYKGVISGNRYRDLVTHLGLKKWTELMHSVLVEVLGMPEHYLPFPLERRRSTGAIMRLVMRDGNLGLYRGQQAYADHGTVRRLLYMLGGYVGRAWLFMYYAPREFVPRGWNLLKGRLSR